MTTKVDDISEDGEWPEPDLEAARQAMKDFEEGNYLTIEEVLLKLGDKKHEDN